MTTISCQGKFSQAYNALTDTYVPSCSTEWIVTESITHLPMEDAYSIAIAITFLFVIAFIWRVIRHVA